jgi:hypothetical protein
MIYMIRQLCYRCSPLFSESISDVVKRIPVNFIPAVVRRIMQRLPEETEYVAAIIFCIKIPAVRQNAFIMHQAKSPDLVFEISIPDAQVPHRLCLNA